MAGHCSILSLTHVWLLQEMQERKKIKKKERKKKKKPESEADPDPDPELDAVRADTSEAEPGESSDEAGTQAASPQGSADHVGPASQEATDAAATAAAGPAVAAAATTADGEWPMYYVSLPSGTAVQSLSADSNPCFEHVHDCSRLLRLARSSLSCSDWSVCTLHSAHCSVLVNIVLDVSQMEGSDSTNCVCRVKAADESW